MARVLDDAKSRVKKLKKKTRKGPKLSTGRRRGGAVALLLLVAAAGGYVVSRVIRGKDGQEANESTGKVGGQKDTTTD